MELAVKLEAFEGPLDLLLHLIDKNKVDIYDIPIAMITDQYLEYVRGIPQEDLDTMSEFLVMAATLLDIKARMLLPKEEEETEEEEDPRAELRDRLLQYKMYKYMSYVLKDRQFDGGRRLFRGKKLPREVVAYEEPVDLEELTKDLTMERLHEIFQSVMQRQTDKIDPIRSRFGKIEKEEISLEDRVKELDHYITEHTSFGFRSLFTQKSTKTEIIVTFLAVLELIRGGRITVQQDQLFDDILIESKVSV